MRTLLILGLLLAASEPLAAQRVARFEFRPAAACRPVAMIPSDICSEEFASGEGRWMAASTRLDAVNANDDSQLDGLLIGAGVGALAGLAADRVGSGIRETESTGSETFLLVATGAMLGGLIGITLDKFVL